MTLKEMIQRRNILASLIVRHKADNADRDEYQRLREEIKTMEEEMKI